MEEEDTTMEEVEESGSARKKPRFSNNREIDEDLHSAQLAVYGRETMMKLLDSKVLISGMQGLGVEIAKNIILAGVKSVTLHDENEVELWDLASSFVYSEMDVGRNRALASLHKLKELNNDVAVSTLTGKLTKEQLAGFKAVVFVDTSFERATEFDDYCHKHIPPIAFIKADVRGLFGSLFCDFGPHFTVLDVDGEKPHSAIIASVSNENHASVSCVGDGLGFQDGDLVVFSEVEGMTELNDGKPREINNVKPHSFVLDEDTTSFGKYVKGGIVTQVQQPKVLDFKPLREAIKNPGDFLHSDVSKSDRPPLLHLAFQALDSFLSKVGRFPSSGSEEDSQKLVSIATDINESSAGSRLEDVDSNVLRHFAFGSKAVLNPMAAMFGGIVGQEVVKACSGKFHPIFQFFYFDSLESLPKEPLDPSEFRLQNSRYDAQISVFGSTLQKKLENASVFVVGAGAHGCEFLKNLALMGVSCGDQGKLTVTDDDVIQKNNLGHQFLFRDWNIGRVKSTVAAAAAAGINSRLKIDALQYRVEPETENVFCDSFWQNLTVVVNGLDNVTQRPYVESRCSQFEKRLLNTQMDKRKANFGRIIPAFATSTAMATGFVCLELYKVLDGAHKLEDYRNIVTNSARSKNQLRRTNELQKIIDDWLSKRYTILRSSWSEINADTIAKPVTQKIGNCWCVALRRQWYAAMRLANHEISESDLPSLETMMNGVGTQSGLADWASVVAYMKQQPFVEDMVVHYNTEPFSEDFENLLMRLLDNDGPLAVGMICYPSYDGSKLKGVVEPDKFERDSMLYQQYTVAHVSLLTGRGIDTRSKKPYLELSDSYGFRSGECGIIRLARHLGLIHLAVQLKIKPRF